MRTWIAAAALGLIATAASAQSSTKPLPSVSPTPAASAPAKPKPKPSYYLQEPAADGIVDAGASSGSPSASSMWAPAASSSSSVVQPDADPGAVPQLFSSTQFNTGASVQPGFEPAKACTGEGLAQICR